jgi:hypothetical protein
MDHLALCRPETAEPRTSCCSGTSGPRFPSRSRNTEWEWVSNFCMSTTFSALMSLISMTAKQFLFLFTFQSNFLAYTLSIQMWKFWFWIWINPILVNLFDLAVDLASKIATLTSKKLTSKFFWMSTNVSF